MPALEGVLPAIVDYIGDDVVVAHNAGFDIGVIRYACAVDNIEWPECASSAPWSWLAERSACRHTACHSWWSRSARPSTSTTIRSPTPTGSSG